MDKETYKAKFWELEAQKEAIEAKTAALKAERDALMVKLGPLQAQARDLGKAIKKIEADDKLPQIDMERAFIVRGLGGNVGDRPE